MDRRQISVGLSALATAGLVVLEACAINIGHPVAGDPAVLRARLAKQLCEVAPLAEERDNYLKSLDGTARRDGIDLTADASLRTPSGSIGVGAHVGAAKTQETDGDISYEKETHTILLDKLLRYRAEIEANYRFVAMNCAAYNLCIQESGGGIPNCQSQQQALLSSQDKFNQIAYELASLKEFPPRHGHRPDCNDDNCGSGQDCRAAHCNVEGGVFLTGCCYREH